MSKKDTHLVLLLPWSYCLSKYKIFRVLNPTKIFVNIIDSNIIRIKIEPGLYDDILNRFFRQTLAFFQTGNR